KNKAGIFSAEDSDIRPPTKSGSALRDNSESENASFQAKLLRALNLLSHHWLPDLVTASLIRYPKCGNAFDYKLENEAAEPKLARDLLDCLTVLPAVATSLPSSRFAVVRYSVVWCYAELCKFLPEEGMLHFIYHVLPLVGDPVNLAHRRGAIEMLSRKPTFSSSLNGEY
ncbi:hypothetical protein VP01_10465g1, partial [Puccinia sorghi]